MRHTRRFELSFAPLLKLWRLFAKVVLVCASASAPACSKPVMQDVAYVGDGTYEGEPPMCLQYRKESHAETKQRSLWVHFNNTCSFPLSCLVYNDVSEQELQVVLLKYQPKSLLLLAGSDESSFDVELNCTWQE